MTRAGKTARASATQAQSRANKAVVEAGQQARERAFEVAERANKQWARLAANVKRPVSSSPSPLSRARLATSKGREAVKSGEATKKPLTPADPRNGDED
ncbi:hypothetical protein [Algiphilus sp.]|uniref:hypothetical protein n=1 Tax=Algiphilus sp. TaxID=1872431 RepID=UPI0025BD8732|nr:hypothetical protein [Algiphilus sp.]MCR9090922.1 hypothetical protein [Pseudomonadota bacterium]